MTVKDSLDNLSRVDTYSLLMFVLFKLSNIPETATLSQLVYVLDKDNFIRLLKYFGGTTITFPTLEDLQVLIYCLTLYKRVEIDKECALEVGYESIPEVLCEGVRNQYESVSNIMRDYFV